MVGTLPRSGHRDRTSRSLESVSFTPKGMGSMGDSSKKNRVMLELSNKIFRNDVGVKYPSIPMTDSPQVKPCQGPTKIFWGFNLFLLVTSPFRRFRVRIWWSHMVTTFQSTRAWELGLFPRHRLKCQQTGSSLDHVSGSVSTSINQAPISAKYIESRWTSLKPSKIMAVLRASALLNVRLVASGDFLQRQLSAPWNWSNNLPESLRAKIPLIDSQKKTDFGAVASDGSYFDIPMMLKNYEKLLHGKLKKGWPTGQYITAFTTSKSNPVLWSNLQFHDLSNQSRRNEYDICFQSASK